MHAGTLLHNKSVGGKCVLDLAVSSFFHDSETRAIARTKLITHGTKLLMSGAVVASFLERL